MEQLLTIDGLTPFQNALFVEIRASAEVVRVISNED